MVRTRAVLSVRLLFPTTEARPYCILYVPNVLWVMRGSRYSFWPLWVLGTFPSHLSIWFLPLPPILRWFPYTSVLTSTQLNTRGGTSADLWSSFCAAFSSLGVCPPNSSYVGLFGFSASSQLRESADSCLGSSSSSMTWILSHNRKLGNHMTYLTCFSSFRNHSPLLTDVHSLENYCFICLVCFLFYREHEFGSHSIFVGSRNATSWILN